MYEQVNYVGTLNVIAACREMGIKRVVMSSSPSTRFDPWNLDVNGLREDELEFPDKRDPPRGFTAEYARTKAMGERAMLEANDGKDLLTVAIAPHQVYGPRDPLFLPSFLVNASGNGKLRIFGPGKNMISMTHVDNYCHALLLGMTLLKPGARILGKFYIATDGGGYQLWKILDEAVVGMGYPSLWKKAHLPIWFLALLVSILGGITFLTGRKFKLNYFTMKMLIINRVFDISNIERDMGYKPIIAFEEGWPDTIAWFRETWLTGKSNLKIQPPSGRQKSQ